VLITVKARIAYVIEQRP